MTDKTCANCNAETVPIGQTVKCFDCGRFHGEDPGLKHAMLKAVVYYADLGYRIENIAENGVLTVTDTSGRTRDVRVTNLVAGRERAHAPLEPGLWTGLYEGVDAVAVYYRDLGFVQRYEAVPYDRRSHVARISGQNRGVVV